MEKSDLNKMFSSKRTFYNQLTTLFKSALRIMGDKYRTASHSQVSMEEPLDTFNCKAYILAKQRMYEIETQKAMLISLSRHDKWKAGGPC